MRVVPFKLGRITAVAVEPNTDGELYSKTFNCQIGHDETTVALERNFGEISMNLFGRQGVVAGNVIFRGIQYHVTGAVLERNPTFFKCQSEGVRPSVSILGWIY